MKLKRFLEYVDNNIDSEGILLNDNEIKYLLDKSNFIISSGQYFINSRVFIKLQSNEYYVIEPKIICTTIQSLIKYTRDSIKELSDEFTNILKKLTTDKRDTNLIHWYYNDILIIEENKKFDIMYFNMLFFKDYLNKAKLNAFETQIFINYIVRKVINIDNSYYIKIIN